MLVDSTFELGIPTHIKFILYKFDHIDSIIISRVLRECKNLSNKKNTYTIRINDFKNAIQENHRLNREIIKTENDDIYSSLHTKPNSVSFIWSILEKLPNLEYLTFNISYDKNYTRITKIDNNTVINFNFKVSEGIFDLTKLFDKYQLDIFNKKLIQLNILKNRCLEKRPYFYMAASALFEILEHLEMDGELNTFEILDSIDPKIEEDNPILLVKTDYTSY